MRRAARPGLPNRSTPLIVWAVGILLAVLVAWLVTRVLRPQELQQIGPVGAAFASPIDSGQVSIAEAIGGAHGGPGRIDLTPEGGFASHEERTA